MGGVFMYNEYELCSCTVTNEEKIRYNLKYTLLEEYEDISCDENLDMSIGFYGIGIESEKIKDNIVQDSYYDKVLSISSKKYEVIQMIKYMNENQVFPVHLKDIVSDEIDTPEGIRLF